MTHPFELELADLETANLEIDGELSEEELDKVSGGNGTFTSHYVGEEGGHGTYTSHYVGEEGGHHFTTFVSGEQGGGKVTV
jgi:hypothetical protein